MHNYLFDVRIFASIRLDAPDEITARDNLAKLLDYADVHLGEIAGTPIYSEMSLDDDSPDLVEVDGEAYDPPLTTG